MSNDNIRIGPVPAEFVQIGVVVKDLDRAIQVLSEVFGLGPFQTITYPPPGAEGMNLMYRGEPGNFSHRLAFTRLGPLELELIQPLTGDSLLTDFVKEHGSGIQHIRFNVPDLPTALEALSGQGIQPVMSGAGLRLGTQWVHLDTVEQVGFVIEVMNVLPNTDGRTPRIVDGKVEA